MEHIDVLADLRDWFEENFTALEDRGLQVSFRHSPVDRDKQSVSLMLESSFRIGQLIVWDTGEAELSLADIRSADVMEEHREITSFIGLRDATQTLLAWLEGAGAR